MKKMSTKKRENDEKCFCYFSCQKQNAIEHKHTHTHTEKRYIHVNKIYILFKTMNFFLVVVVFPLWNDDLNT